MPGLLLWLLHMAAPDTLSFCRAAHPPALEEPIDSSRYGTPQLRLPTAQGTAQVWLLAAADSFFIVALIPDSTPYWGDDFVLSLNPNGRVSAQPGHQDFQWYFRRTLDSTVIFRGRNGHWEAPRGDPDWRLGSERSGGGWEVSGVDDSTSWGLILRLDPAWFEERQGTSPRLAFRIYDDSPQGWFAWPKPRGTVQASAVEQNPMLWGAVSLPHIHCSSGVVRRRASG